MDFFSYFINEAPKYPSDFQANNSAESMPWLDKELMEHSAACFNKNYMGVFFATLYSGIELFAIKSTTSVLMSSGTVSSRNSAYVRSLRTSVHMKLWLSSGMQIFNSSSDAYKSIQSVRGKHKTTSYFCSNRSATAVDFMDKHVLEPYRGTLKELQKLKVALKADLDFVDTSEMPSNLLNWDTTTTLGQFDLGVVQFIIFYHTIKYPEAFGIYNLSDEDIKAFLHASAVFGRILGMEDRFNVALNLPQETHDKFYKNIIVASWKNIDEIVLHVMSLTMEGIHDGFIVPPLLRLKCWLYYSLNKSIVGFEGKYILQLMNIEDKFCHQLIKVVASPLNLNGIYSYIEKYTFNHWLDGQLKRHHIIIP